MEGLLRSVLDTLFFLIKMVVGLFVLRVLAFFGGYEFYIPYVDDLLYGVWLLVGRVVRIAGM